tara:strand:- start:2933 stop:3235 length:303 start_codon:yes stop_codon:yes gene_type:complete
MNTNTKVSTKPTAADAAIETNLTLDWDGMTEDDLRALAQQALIVKLQGAWRKGTIPTEATVKVTDYKVGNRVVKSKLSLLEQIAAMSPEDKAKALSLLAP